MLWIPVLIACTSGPDAGPGSGTSRVLTYNVQGLPDALSAAERPTLERMERIAPLLADYEVVGLQEDFDATNHDALIEGVPHPAVAWFDDPVSPDRVYGAGLSVLSSLGTPVEVFESHYQQCHGLLDGASDCLASKGLLIQRLELAEGIEIDVYDTHHEAGGGPEDDAARRSQVEEAIASIEGLSAGRAVVFAGDFNLRWSDPEDLDELQLYADVGLRDACREVSCPEDDHIDHVLLRSSEQLSLEVIAWSREEAFVDEDGADLSDHPAIVAEIAWSIQQ